MDTGQNYSNHARVVPLFHVVTLGGSIVVFIASVVNLAKTVGTEGGLFSAILICAIAFILMHAAYFTRTFSLRVQDRIIRAEENARHYRRTGKALDERLTMRQIIALRFAPDDEYDELASRAVNDGLTEKQIKQSIKDWKGDYVRI